MKLNAVLRSPIFWAWGMLALLSLVWGSSFLLMKRALLAFTPAEVGGMRIFFAWLVLLPIALREWRKLNRIHWPQVLQIGFFGNVLPAFCFTLAVKNVDSGIVGVLNSLTPIFILVLGVVQYQQQLLRTHLLGLTLAFLGAVLLVLARANWTLGGVNIYFLAILFATLCYGYSTNLIKYRLQEIRPLPLSSLAFFWFGLPVSLYLFGFTDVPQKAMETSAWWPLGAVALLGMVGTGFALAVYNRLIQLTDALFAGMVTYIIPVVSVVLGLWDGEQITLPQSGAILLILIGVYVVNLGTQKAKRKNKA